MVNTVVHVLQLHNIYIRNVAVSKPTAHNHLSESDGAAGEGRTWAEEPWAWPWCSATLPCLSACWGGWHRMAGRQEWHMGLHPWGRATVSPDKLQQLPETWGEPWPRALGAPCTVPSVCPGAQSFLGEAGGDPEQTNHCWPYKHSFTGEGGSYANIYSINLVRGFEEKQKKCHLKICSKFGHSVVLLVQRNEANFIVICVWIKENYENKH